MLLYRNVKPDYILRLRVGSFFENATITAIVKKNDYLSITTSTGDVYNIHPTAKGYNVFHRRKELRELRQKREQEKNKGKQ
jgi:hypothetical protein